MVTDATAAITTVVLPGVEYEARVWAVDTDGQASPSVAIHVVTPMAETGDSVPPPAPRNVTFGGATSDGIVLVWTPPTDVSDVVAYNVAGYRGPMGKAGK